MSSCSSLDARMAKLKDGAAGRYVVLRRGQVYDDQTEPSLTECRTRTLVGHKTRGAMQLSTHEEKSCIHRKGKPMNVEGVWLGTKQWEATIPSPNISTCSSDRRWEALWVGEQKGRERRQSESKKYPAPGSAGGISTTMQRTPKFGSELGGRKSWLTLRNMLYIYLENNNSLDPWYRAGLWKRNGKLSVYPRLARPITCHKFYYAVNFLVVSIIPPNNPLLAHCKFLEILQPGVRLKICYAHTS